jgi:hypothetical protein
MANTWQTGRAMPVMDTKGELTLQRAFADAEEQRGLCKRLEAMLREGQPDAALALVRQGCFAEIDNAIEVDGLWALGSWRCTVR